MFRICVPCVRSTILKTVFQSMLFVDFASMIELYLRVHCMLFPIDSDTSTTDRGQMTDAVSVAHSGTETKSEIYSVRLVMHCRISFRRCSSSNIASLIA